MVKTDVLSTKQRFGIIGTSALLDREIDKALLIAPIDLSVLITGESGVGKEVFSQIIHQNSLRKHGQYIAVNCGAIPEGTIDSELFGHEKGSFTGALGERKGYFEVADGGTIFLDEVGEMPMSTQARLLRILEYGEFIKVGSSKVQKTDVRIVAATNMNLLQAIRNGRFREDLYFRLNTVPIEVPPLRERKEDIPLLFRKFVSDFAEKYRVPAIQLTEESRLVLVNYRWPGNVRELKNIAERMMIIEQEREITAATLKTYLINPDMERLPALIPPGNDTKNFGSEREILYQVLFDMRKDVNDLKKLVHDIMIGNIASPQVEKTAPYRTTVNVQDVTPPTVGTIPVSASKEEVVPYVDDYVEETMSLEEVEKEVIRKALERHGGKRRNAALDLKISERTLYRKIKEYGLE
ncbi:MAG: sigma-54 dependent transcriptional regulator [Dysgonamonadaceae bacterium]|jgi:transcriptional regulator with PAS, ATPase and Fis domain|nr:sigma-54 dependent transcriptional regulator [Dysgonamonadaceae bacterium]